MTAVTWPEWSLADVVAARPPVRVNQVGYLVGAPMRATLVHAGAQPVEFVVRDRGGVEVYAGRSSPWPVRPEPTSGMTVHVLEFTGLPQGSAYRIEAAGEVSHRFAVGSRIYRRLATDALRFFTLMRSGAPISEDVAPGYGRPAGHAGVPPNRGDRQVPAWTGRDADELYPGWRCAGTFDVSGGW